MKKCIIRLGILGFSLGLLLVVAVGYETYSFLHGPISEKGSHPQVVLIPKGTGFDQVLRILSEQELLDAPQRFRMLAQYREAFSLIQAGEFEIHPHWTPDQLLSHLIEGRSQLYKVTIPEGLTYEEIAFRLEKAGFGKAASYLELKTHASLRRLVQIQPLVASLEGFLFPETYFFPKGETEENILAAMIDQFNQNYSQEFRQQTVKIGMSGFAVITLASIVEKESAVEQERALIAAVFHNRLKRKMRLESDPTVIYGIKDFDGNLTKKHLKTPMPYNTYVHFGLPPGPICNPGKAAIESTLFPADVNYLYFVARGDGTSQFSSNLKAHNRAVYRYQKKRKSR